MQQFLDENHQVKSPDEMKLVYKLPEVKKLTTHQILVNRILEVSGQDRSQYAKWCNWVNRSKLSMNAVLDLCDVANSLPDKYNKGGYIRKRL
jgi:histone deacetylase complex regulatory component SIN3